MLSCLCLAFAMWVGARQALAGDCAEAIDEATTRKIFDGLVKAAPGDGCTLENVNTEKASLQIEWKKAGQVEEAIVVVPTACVGGPKSESSLTASVPPSLAAACPAAVAVTLTLVSDARSSRLMGGAGVPIPGRSRRRPIVPALTAAIVAAAALAAYAMRRSKNRKQPATPAPPAGSPSTAAQDASRSDDLPAPAPAEATSANSGNVGGS